MFATMILAGITSSIIPSIPSILVPVLGKNILSVGRTEETEQNNKEEKRNNILVINGKILR